MVYWFAELILNVMLAWLVGYWLGVLGCCSSLGVNWVMGIVALWG